MPLRSEMLIVQCINAIYRMPAFTSFSADVVINMNIDRKLPKLYT